MNMNQSMSASAYAAMANSQGGASIHSFAGSHGGSHAEEKRSGAAGAWWSLPVVMPTDVSYLRWWLVTVLMSALTGILVPFHIAFSDHSPFTGFWAAMEVIIDVVFFLDILLQLTSVAVFTETGGWITQRNGICRAYAKGMLSIDLLVTVPWDQIVLAASGLHGSGSNKALFISLLGLIKLGRMYRLYEWFTYISHNMLLSQLLLMLVRNESYLFYLMHWAACTLYFIARVDYFAVDNTWIGRAAHRFEDQPLYVKYIYSYYFAVSTYTGLGDSDFATSSVAESIFMILYMSFNVVVTAYILGTVSMLMVLADKRSKLYRDRMGHLHQFVDMNEIPKGLASSMQEHLELHHNSEHTGEERVLNMYPAAIKRRVKRHLYLSTLRTSYLYKGCRAKFLDAVLGLSHVDVFLPSVQILACGDIVNELMIIVEGQVQTTQVSANNVGQDKQGEKDPFKRVSQGNAQAMALAAVTKSASGDLKKATVREKNAMSAGKGALMRYVRAQSSVSSIADPDGDVSQRGSTRGRISTNAVAPSPPPKITADDSPDPTSHNEGLYAQIISAGSPSRFGGTSPSPTGAVPQVSVGGDTSVRAGGGDRSLSPLHNEITRMSSNGEGFGDALTRMMSLNGSAPEEVQSPARSIRRSAVQAASMVRAENPVNSVHGTAAYQAAEGRLSDLNAGECLGELAFFAEIPSSDSMWTACVTRLLVLDKDAYEHLATQHPQQTRHMLENLQHRMEQNLQLAWAGAVDVIPDLPDIMVNELSDYVFGDKPLNEMPTDLRSTVDNMLCRDDVEVLQKSEQQAATSRQLLLKVDQMRVFNFLAGASQSSHETIKTMMGQGVSPDASDYDRRTGLMLACHEGSEAVARLLLESGADPMAKDNFGNTAMYEAVKMGHDDLIDLLLKYKASLGVDGLMVAAQMCTCVFEGDLVMLKRILRSGCDVDAADYDKRCALHIACCEGNVTAVKILIEEGGATADFQDRWGATPLSEAERVGAKPVIDYLKPITALAEQGLIKCMKHKSAPTYKAYLEAQAAREAALAAKKAHHEEETEFFGQDDLEEDE